MAGAGIHPIDKASIHRICSGQVILDLATAVKELVENSLDAGATSIEVKLKQHGEESIEVSDNGSGVSSDNYQGLTLKYHTSKLSIFSDLQSLTSFGFRGEALSSLCSLADVTILTRTKDDETGTRLSYNRAGVILSKETAARQVGTTVIVSKLFSPLPVRHKEFQRNVKREYSRMISILQAYALISKNVRLVCTNLVGKSNRSTILRTQGASIKENIVNIFGPKTMACLDALDITLPDGLSIEGFVSKPGSGSGRGSSDRQFFYVNGRPVDMPKFGKLLNELYKSFNSVQFPMAVLNFRLPTTAYDVNVTPDKRKLFLHSESSFLAGLRDALGKLYAPDKYTYAVREVDEQSPFDKSYMADAQTQIDIEPDEGEAKDEEEEEEEEEGKEEQRQQKEEEEAKQSEPKTLKAQVLDFSAFAHESMSIRTPVRSTKGTSMSEKRGSVQGKLTGFISQKRRSEDSTDPVSEEPLLKRRTLPTAVSSVPPQEESCGIIRTAETSGTHKESEGPLSETPLLKKCSKFGLVPTYFAPKPQEERVGRPREGQNKVPQNPVPLESDDDDDDDNPSSQVPDKDNSPEPPHTPCETAKSCSGKRESCASEVANPVASTEMQAAREDENERPNSNSVIKTLNFEIEKVRSRIRKGMFQYNRSASPAKALKGRAFKAATLAFEGAPQDKEAALASATKELERSFRKEDFKRMKVIGQFNLGFIIAKLDSDLFIIDQHASDEKYNFERLSKFTVLNRQPLIRPLPLNLSAAEEIAISTHMEVFRKNGFDFTEREDALPGHRILLSAVPFSKNVTFGVSDVHELLSSLSGDYGGSLSHGSYLVQPSRVRAMLASRACRSSIMIGDALSKKEMEKVVNHLADLDAPWNCPHGRPTMRHLYDLNAKKKALLSS